MPLVGLTCPNGHRSERFYHAWAQLYQALSRVCGTCGHPYVVGPSYGVPLTYFSEKNARTIDNLGATIRSHGEHVRVMKARGVEPACEWHVSRKWTDGLPTTAAPPKPRAE
jgi:hypothetical protein